MKFHARDTKELDTKVGELEKHGRVLAVGQDNPVTAITTYPQGTNPSYASQWDFGPSYVNFPGAWNAPTPDTGQGVRVAVVDTGVEADHPDLQGHVVQGRDFVLADETKSNYGQIDGDGHGTHVAGTIAAKDDTNGIVGGALDATIVPVRVLDCQGAGFDSAVANGVIWAADPSGGHAKVINLSLGGPVNDPVLASAMQYALGQNVVVVAAAGNAGTSVCNPASNTSPLYPAAFAGDQTYFPGMIAVGATGFQVMSRANYSNCNSYVTVAAPGSSIYSTYASQPNHSPTYTTLSGTSMATPHVAAVAALVLANCPTDTPAQVLTRVTTGTKAITGFGAGVGMVDAATATAAC